MFSKTKKIVKENQTNVPLNQPLKCPKCKGMGNYLDDKGYGQEQVSCPMCNGHGSFVPIVSANESGLFKHWDGLANLKKTPEGMKIAQELTNYYLQAVLDDHRPGPNARDAAIRMWNKKHEEETQRKAHDDLYGGF